MKKFSALLLVTSTILSISAVSHAEQILTIDGRAGISGPHRWEKTTLAEKQTLQNVAVAQVQMQMKDTCLAFGANQRPVVLDATPAGSRYNELADFMMYVMSVTYTCDVAAQ